MQDRVGIGTLYRRFPTREALLVATGNERFMSVARASRARDADGSADAIRRLLQDFALNICVFESLAASLWDVAANAFQDRKSTKSFTGGSE